MPRRKRSPIDELILGPWWVSLALAFVLYPFLTGVRALAPLAPFIFFILVCISLISALRAWANRRTLERQTSIESVQALSWKQFEDLLAEAFRRQGYKVTENLGGGADGGVDLTLRRDGGFTLVQCKRWKERKPVGVQTVRELYGVLTDRRADGAKLVATTNFTPDAIAFAKDKPIQLVDSASLLTLLGSVQTSRSIALSAKAENTGTGVIEAPTCALCGSTMVLREARRGANVGKSFWGCSRYPGCRGIRQV